MVVSDLIKASLRKIGAISSGETPETSRYAEALSALQQMLRIWASQQINVYASTQESFTLTGGQSLYTWGSGGNITTTRPHSVLFAFVRDTGGTDNPVLILSKGEYLSLTTKATSGRPEYLYYHPLYPLSYLYLYPTPQDAETMYLDSLKPFTETSSFATIDDTISFPPNYEEALVYNLALRLAPEYGVQISQEAALIARNSYDSLVTLNSANQVEPVHLSLPISRRGGYNINQG